MVHGDELEVMLVEVGAADRARDGCDVYNHHDIS